jgi:hypothetical protein
VEEGRVNDHRTENMNAAVMASAIASHSPVVMALISFPGAEELRSSQLQQPCSQFPCCPVKPASIIVSK